MRVIDVLQGSEAWDKLRARPTASEFSKFCTPAKGEYAAGATDYASKIVAKRRGFNTEIEPTYWMERGIEMEPSAKRAYERETGHVVEDVGFIVPDGTDLYGGSPDGLIPDGRGGYQGGLEAKCPKPETLIAWIAGGVLPLKHRTQVQSLLFISGLPWWDFYGFHPGIPTFLVHVEPDLKYHTKMAACLLLLLQEIELIESLCPPTEHEYVAPGANQDNVTFVD